MPIDPELAAEMQRRGLTPAAPRAPAMDPELAAEMQRRGIFTTPQPSIINKLLSNSVPGGGGFDPLGWVAKGGGMLNKELQAEAGDYAESLGRKAAKNGDYPESLMGQAALVAPAAVPATLAEAAIPQNRLAAGLTLLGPLAKGAGTAKGVIQDALASRAASTEASEAAAMAKLGIPTTASESASAVPKNSKPGTLAQLIQGRAGRSISLGEAQYALDNPKVLTDAQSIPDANKAYAEAAPGLVGKVQSLAKRLNVTAVGPSDYTEAIDRAGRLLNGTPIPSDKATELTAQDALEGVQTINKAMRDKRFTMSMPEDQVRTFMELKDGLMGFLQENGAPGLRAAGKNLFEAHVKDSFSSWAPKNKFGSTDALRTMTGMGQMGGAAALAAAGHPLAALPIAANAALTSPRVIGGLIKNAAAAPGAIAAGGPAIGAMTSNASGGPSNSTIPPMLANLLEKLKNKQK